MPGAADGRLAWIETRVANAMRAKQEKLKALWAGQSRCVVEAAIWLENLAHWRLLVLRTGNFCSTFWIHRTQGASFFATDRRVSKRLLRHLHFSRRTRRQSFF